MTCRCRRLVSWTNPGLAVGRAGRVAQPTCYSPVQEGFSVFSWLRLSEAQGELWPTVGLPIGSPAQRPENLLLHDASRLIRWMSWSRLLIPSLVKRRYRCPSTVRTEMTSRSAISRLDSPAATKLTI